MMHMHFQTRIPDPNVVTDGIRGILNDDIKWQIGKAKDQWFDQKDFGSFYKSTNVIVHWGMYIRTKGQAGFDVAIHIEKIIGDNEFEYLNADKDNDLIEFKITDLTEWTVNERKYHHDQHPDALPMGEIYARSCEIDFVGKEITVYFG